jgi:hypothetical protein
MTRTASPASAGVSSEPSQPSPSRPTRRSPAGADPASQMSSGLTGSGPTEASSTVKKDPWKDTTSVVSISRSSSSASSNTAPRCPAGTGNSARSPGMAGCRPKTGSTRPGASPASEASCFATSTGWRPGSTEIPLPTLRCEVLASANVIPVNGSTAGPKTVSGSHSESTPAASSRATDASNWSGAPAAPRDMPILIRMLPTLRAGARGGEPTVRSGEWF